MGSAQKQIVYLKNNRVVANLEGGRGTENLPLLCFRIAALAWKRKDVQQIYWCKWILVFKSWKMIMKTIVIAGKHNQQLSWKWVNVAVVFMII